jgi:predicted  nucleic acid-binding Zn-ribbon protein
MSDLETEIALVKRDIDQLNTVIGKLDVTIEKLSDIATSINRMLAVQETRVDSQEKSLSQNVEIIHDRITDHREEVTMEIEKSHKALMSEIKALRGDQQEHHKQMNERLNKLEQWRWTVVGGAVVIGFLASKLPWNAIF